ncbi:MAG: rhodanese-like domain-containing protein [Gammaproteobacteria bacterium]|nr:rhodanese-like domain-containing protein [Gammaproteobacteria bacterium]
MTGVTSASASSSTQEVEVYFDDTQITMEEIVFGLAQPYSGYYWAKRVNISTQQAKDLIDANPGTVIVDVREEDEYCDGHIPDAAMSPWISGVFQSEYNTILPSSGGVLLACRSGNRTVEASDFLASSAGGYYTRNHKSSVVVYNMIGGMDDWSYETSTCSAAYNITSPSPGSALSSGTVTFSWDSGADQYWLWVGTSEGGYDVYSANQGTTTSATVPDLPGSQETLYVRLFSVVDGEWSHNDYTYTACNMKAGIQSPTSGSTLSSATQTFTWNDTGAAGYWLWIGSSAGDYDIYSGNLGANTSVTLSELPANGETLYVRLFSKVNGAWVYDTDYTYTACDKMAEIQNPSNGSTLGSATQTFTWSNSGADGYWLWIGTSAGGYDLYSGNVGTDTSVTVSELPANGETLYARLWSKVDGIWIYNTDNTYTASALIAAIQSPSSGSALDSTTETFTWNNTGADGYWLWVGTSAGDYDVYSGNLGTNTSVSVSDLPNGGGTLYVRLWSKVDGIWIYNTDCTYTTTVLAAIQSPGSGSVLGSTTVTFSWNNTGASGYWLWIGTSQGDYDVYSSGDLGTSTSTVASGLPDSGETLYARLWSKMGGTWIYNTDFTYTATGP